jgi:hypothetical protein
MSTALRTPVDQAPGQPGAEVAAPPARSWRTRLRGFLPYLVLGAGVLLFVLISGAPDPGLPYDPRSAGPVGTKAVADVLRELGADVELVAGVPEESGGTALLLVDQLDEGTREDLLDWVSAGGRLVVADPYSPLTPEVTGRLTLGFTNPSIAPGDCGLDALDQVGRVTSPGGVVYEAPAGSVGCYPRNEGFWLVARSEGEGTIVSLGGAGGFTNEQLGNQDNAVLATYLLAPDGEGSVAILRPPPPGSGDASLMDLIPVSVRLAILQLLIAFFVFVLWRARRLGRPVVEATPVEVPGSELVVARGNLLQTSGASGHAAQVLRDDARRVLAERFGLPADAPPQVVAESAAARTGARVEEVLSVIAPQNGGPVDEARLVGLAQAVENVRRATLTDPRPRG